MEHEITNTTTQNAKSILTTIVKFNTALCAFLAVTWVLAAMLNLNSNPWLGFSGIGFLLGLLVTISALNARLRVELEEPDSAE
jgi:multisubunit Na+/H+ antiporter MnhB subunit